MDTMNIIMQWNIQMNKKLAMKHGVKLKSKRKKKKHSFKQCLCQFLVRSFCLVWFLISRQGLVLELWVKSDFPLLWKDGKRDLVCDSLDQYLFQPMKLRCYEFLSIKHCLRYVCTLLIHFSKGFRLFCFVLQSKIHHFMHHFLIGL